MNDSNSTAPTNGRRMRRSDLVALAPDFVPTEQQIGEVRRYLADKLLPEELHPAHLATAQSRIVEMLATAATEGRLNGLGRNPAQSILQVLYHKAVGLGVLDGFLSDPRVEQINVHGPRDIWLQVAGTWRQVVDESQLFRDIQELKEVTANLLRRVGRDLSPLEPILDIRFTNPTLRVHINQARREHGLSLFIRRPRSQSFTVEQLITLGDFDRPTADILVQAAQRLIGTAFFGPVGSGKTAVLEMFIDNMPNVPVVVVDDAGDCNPSRHPAVVIMDLPTSIEDERMTLGTLTKAGLREGDVLVVAEVRGGEEASILISDAPSMRCVVTTAHGPTIAAGLTRLVSKAREAGNRSLETLRAEIKAAFPLCILMDRRGNRRFVAHIAHNFGWDEVVNNWRLKTLVTAEHDPDGRITWVVKDDNLDVIQPLLALDRMNLGAPTSYRQNDPARLFQRALEAMGREQWALGIHLLGKVLKATPNDERVRAQMMTGLEKLGLASELRQRAIHLVEALAAAVSTQSWVEADGYWQQIEQESAMQLFARIHPDYARLAQIIQYSQRVRRQFTFMVRGALEMATAEGIPWTELERALDSLEGVDTGQLLVDDVRYAFQVRRHLLTTLIERAPLTSRLYFAQQLQNLPQDIEE